MRPNLDRRTLAALLALLLLFLSVDSPAAASADQPAVQEPYTITNLGYVTPYSINNKRQVVGYALGTCHAFFWEDGDLTYLRDSSGPLCGPTFALDINENRQVVGHTGRGLEEQAFLWTDANANGVIDLGEYQTLASLPGYSRTFARRINNPGTVLGYAQQDPSLGIDSRHVYWSNGSVFELTGMTALNINDQGTIVGLVAGGSVPDGVRWDNGVITPIHEDFTPYAINTRGEIPGLIQGAGALWLPVPAYGLPAGLSQLGFSGAASDINEVGQVVGGGKYLWQNGELTDIHTLLPPNSGWRSLSVSRINDHGDMIGTGTFNDQQRGFLLSPPRPKWTLLFYLAADNDLSTSYPPIFQHLESMANLPGVRILVLWDPLGAGGSWYYEVQYDADLNRFATYTEGVNRWSQGELNVGAPFTLSDFVRWGVARSPSEHYALVLDDHGSGLGGLAWDETSSRDFITLAELKLALDTAYDDTGRKMDVLYMAMCLMGMLEDAYQVRGRADYYVASEDLQTTYSRYLTGFDPAMSPAQLAAALADAYAVDMVARNKAYTISAVDLGQLDLLVSATNGLGQALAARMEVISGTLGTVANLVQRFDNQRPRGLTLADTYVDLYDFADLIERNLGGEPAIVAQAGAVKAAISNYVLYEAHASTLAKNLDNSHGASIFFPATASSFYNPANYAFAVGADWRSRGRASAGAGPGAADTWAGFLVDYFQATQPGGPDDPTPPEPLPKEYTTLPVYLPLITRP